MSEPIDLQYGPKTYFRPERFEKYLLKRVKGAVLRKKLTAMLAQGRYEEVRILVDEIGGSKTDQRALERLHPMFMGGHYLPELEFGEVEIARICLRSVTSDVISVYAKTVMNAPSVATSTRHPPKTPASTRSAGPGKKRCTPCTRASDWSLH